MRQIIRKRGASNAFILGATLGVLVTGLVLPFAIGDSSKQAAGGTTSVSGTAGESVSGTAGNSVGGTGGESLGGGPAVTAPEGVPSVGGSTSARKASPGGSRSSAGPGQLGASDTGISNTSIKLGLAILTVGSVNKIGIATPLIDTDQQKAAWQAYVDDLNDRGGIHGRKIEPVYRIFDTLSDDDKRAACLYFTQDAKVFAVLDAAGNLSGPAALCITRENKTPFITYGSAGFTRDWFANAGGLLFTIHQEGTRHMAVLAQRLEESGALEGKTIGVLVDESAANPRAGDALMAELAKRGHKANRSLLSSDPSVAASQIPVEVQRMRTAGVDAVILLTYTLPSAQFVQTAEGQQYFPKYFASDWQALTSDSGAEVMPSSFDGATAVSVLRTGEWRIPQPEPPFDSDCRKLYEKRTNDRLKRGDDKHALTIRACALMHLFEVAANAAGPSPTRPGLSGAMQGLGTVPVSMMGRGSFAPGKFDFADTVRLLRWKFDCKCWLPATDYSPSPY